MTNRILTIGALSATVIVLMIAGGPVDSLAQTSPLPTPDAQLAAWEIEAEQAIGAAAARLSGASLSVSPALRDAARATGYRLIADRRCRDAQTTGGLYELLDSAGYSSVLPAAWAIICGWHQPAAIAHGLELGAPWMLAARHTVIGVGYAHVGEQWRVVVVTVGGVEQEPLVTSGEGTVVDVHLPVVVR